MKKSLSLMLTATIAMAANAEGYQVNTLSARQGGMGHTGVAQHLDAESMYFNPAGLGFMTKQHDASFSINLLNPYAKCRIGDKWYEADNSLVTPIFANFAYSINDNWKIGVSLYTPYGSALNWTKDWPGAMLNQQVKLTSYTLQPTLSWKVSDNFSIGAGVTMNWGDVNLDKGLINAATMDQVMGITGSPQRYGEICPASANLKGQTDLAWGLNAGLMWDVCKQLSFGASFRTTSWLKVHQGTATVTYADAVAEAALSPSLNGMHEATFKAKMPMPWVLSMGTAYHPTESWTLAFDAQLTGWHAYRSLDVTFPAIPAYDQHITKDYHNSWAFRIGAQYAINDNVEARIGCALDSSPINDEHYNPETPGTTKYEPSAGLSWKLYKNLSLDLAVAYIYGKQVDNAKCDYEDLLLKARPELQPYLGSPDKVFTADYKVSALNVAVGLSVSF